MEYIRLGNFELYPDQLNWSVPGVPEDYYGEKKVNYILSDFNFDEFIDKKIGKGWRLPKMKEMVYLGRVKSLDIAKTGKLYLPSISHYIVDETTNLTPINGNYYQVSFFNPENKGPIVLPWMPGFFISNSGMRNFKIQPVRDA